MEKKPASGGRRVLRLSWRRARRLGDSPGAAFVMGIRRSHFICAGVSALAAICPAGVANAGPYSQENMPTGPYAGKPPLGYVVLIHGGGWYLVGAGMAGLMNPTADRLNSAGYATLNVDYRAGRKSLPDV